MAGGAGSEAAHRAWWTRVVAAVAYAPGPNASAAIAGGAPVAALARELGPPRALPANAPGGAADPRILSAIIMILLLAEWASRRLRGRR